MEIDRRTRWKRINRYGFTPEEARNCPLRTPLWMYRIEQEEGMQMRDLLNDAADCAKHTGYTLADLAREWGVAHATLQHWATKWSINFPRGASLLQRERAKELAGKINERRAAA
jgi:hypothetical protein